MNGWANGVTRNAAGQHGGRRHAQRAAVVRCYAGGVMILALLISLALGAGQGTGSPSDPGLAARIEIMFHTIVTTDDNSQATAVSKDALELYGRHGLPAVAEVGGEASYEFVVLLTSDQIPLARQKEISKNVTTAAEHGLIPRDAGIYYAARLRLEQIKLSVRSRPPSNPALRDQIENIYRVDQGVRQQNAFDAAKMEQTDRGDSALLQKILDQNGIPTYSTVGPQATGDFVILIQHQAADFRARVLPQLKANVDAGEADPDSYAKVYDRSQYDLGKLQFYGEQFICGAGEKMHEAPMDDAEHVNDRRAAFGMVRAEIQERLIAELMPQFCPPAEPAK